mmetsp:Transcript_35319/g.89408  ORF Transcript_35319/g.89408 Transcript_35319/m.89408 type:complete len:221 (+) Transcript_35319:174-836(+)
MLKRFLAFVRQLNDAAPPNTLQLMEPERHPHTQRDVCQQLLCSSPAVARGCGAPLRASPRLGPSLPGTLQLVGRCGQLLLEPRNGGRLRLARHLPQRGAHHQLVVKREGGQLAHRVPARVLGVIRRLDPQLGGGHQRGVRHRDGPPARVTPRVAKRAHLRQQHLRRGGVHARLLAQLARRRRVQRLALVHKPAGQRPLVLERVVLALNEQQLRWLVGRVC